MPVTFTGFPRLVEPRALKPGRWFIAAGPSGAQLCMLTGAGGDQNGVVLMFGLGKLDALEFRTARLSTFASPLSTVEDEMVFSPGEGPDKLRLQAAVKRPFPSGSLLRLTNGEIGVGFAETLNGRLFVVSLASGLEADGFDLVFDRWCLSVRRGANMALVGYFRGSAWKE